MLFVFGLICSLTLLQLKKSIVRIHQPTHSLLLHRNPNEHQGVRQMQVLVEVTELPRRDTLGSFLSATIHSDIKSTLVSVSEQTGMTINQVSDEVLYNELIEILEQDGPEG